MDLRKQVLQNRLFWLGAGFVLLFGAVTARFYQLQILNGADSRAEFADQITREQTTPGARGMIYDRNGNVLAYNELTYAVSIKDSGTYGTRSERNAHLNGVISETIDVIESHGDSLQDTLPIAYDAAGSLSYTQEGTALRRFLADVYGHGDPADCLGALFHGGQQLSEIPGGYPGGECEPGDRGSYPGAPAGAHGRGHSNRNPAAVCGQPVFCSDYRIHRAHFQ